VVLRSVLGTQCRRDKFIERLRIQMPQLLPVKSTAKEVNLLDAMIASELQVMHIHDLGNTWVVGVRSANIYRVDTQVKGAQIHSGRFSVNLKSEETKVSFPIEKIHDVPKAIFEPFIVEIRACTEAFEIHLHKDPEVVQPIQMESNAFV